MRLFYVSLALALLLAAPARAGLFGPDYEDDIAKATACYEAVRAKPELKALNDRFYTGSPTLAQLADEYIPTESEANLIHQMRKDYAPCRELRLVALRRHHPFAVSIELTYHFKTDLVYVQLVQRRITFGNANRLLYEARLEASANWDRYAQAQSDAQRRALADSLDRMAQQARTAPAPLYPPSGRLTCRWIGPTLYCDPY